MDKVISARVDERTARLLDRMSRALGLSKKAILERALDAYFEALERADAADPFEATCGAWARSEPVEGTVSEARAAFNRSFERRRR